MDNNDTVILRLGGKDRELRLSHSVLKKFLAKNEISMDGFDEAVEGYQGLCDLLLLMIQRKDPDVTEAQLDDWLDADDIRLGEVFGKVSDAISAAFEDPDLKGRLQENPPKRRGRGASPRA